MFNLFFFIFLSHSLTLLTTDEIDTQSINHPINQAIAEIEKKTKGEVKIKLEFLNIKDIHQRALLVNKIKQADIELAFVNSCLLGELKTKFEFLCMPRILPRDKMDKLMEGELGNVINSEFHLSSNKKLLLKFNAFTGNQVFVANKPFNSLKNCNSHSINYITSPIGATFYKELGFRQNMKAQPKDLRKGFFNQDVSIISMGVLELQRKISEKTFDGSKIFILNSNHKLWGHTLISSVKAEKSLSPENLKIVNEEIYKLRPQYEDFINSKNKTALNFLKQNGVSLSEIHTPDSKQIHKAALTSIHTHKKRLFPFVEVLGLLN